MRSRIRRPVCFRSVSPIPQIGICQPGCHIDKLNFLGGTTPGHIHSKISNWDGEIVWEIAFPNRSNETYGIYQADRFRFAPIVSTPNLIHNETHQFVEWDVWYNFRSKTEFTGEYYISVNGKTVETDLITFPRYWQSTKVRYFLDESIEEIEEISLVVADEAGHLSNDTDKYSSIGKLDIEQSQIAIILSSSIGGTVIFGALSYTLYYFIRKKKMS